MMRMQRWMLWTVMGVVGLTVMFFVARYAKREYHLRQPSKIWVPIALRADISMEDQKNLAKQIEDKLRTEEILRAVVADIGLQEKFKQPGEAAAVKELSRTAPCPRSTSAWRASDMSRNSSARSRCASSAMCGS